MHVRDCRRKGTQHACGNSCRARQHLATGHSLPATQPNNGMPCHATGKSVAYNLAEAGKAIGVNRSTVLRAIRRGTISATRDPTTGGWLIEASELHRVFPPVAPDN